MGENSVALRMFAIEHAIKLVSTQNVEKKTKAVFDLAESILAWINKEYMD